MIGVHGVYPHCFWDQSIAQQSLNIAILIYAYGFVSCSVDNCFHFACNAKSNSTKGLESAAGIVFAHEKWILKMDEPHETKAAIPRNHAGAL